MKRWKHLKAAICDTSIFNQKDFIFF
jgi:hypothetical protein